MSDKNEFTSDILLADLMLRVTAMEKLLIQKDIISKEDLISVINEIAQGAAKLVMEKVNASKNLDEFISNLKDVSIKKN